MGTSLKCAELGRASVLVLSPATSRRPASACAIHLGRCEAQARPAPELVGVVNVLDAEGLKHPLADLAGSRVRRFTVPREACNVHHALVWVRVLEYSRDLSVCAA